MTRAQGLAQLWVWEDVWLIIRTTKAGGFLKNRQKKAWR